VQAGVAQVLAEGTVAAGGGEVVVGGESWVGGVGYEAVVEGEGGVSPFFYLFFWVFVLIERRTRSGSLP